MKALIWLRAAATLGCFCASVTAVTAGTTAVYEDAGKGVFEVTVPDFWTLRVGGDRDLTPSSEDELRVVERVFGLTPEKDHGVWIGLISPPRFHTLQDAKDYARSLGGQLAKTTEITSSKDRRISGYPAHVIEGTGRRDGRAVNFTVMLLDMQNSRVVVGLTVLEKGYDPNAVADINAILQSIKAR
ncbi:MULTISPECIES: hypothetical protein [unclassified Shimia]|uniref:hypothetical protein n=1 Tax=unclassified Shimia TaxID=2630038 RepID=UPI0031047483